MGDISSASAPNMKLLIILFLVGVAVVYGEYLPQQIAENHEVSQEGADFQYAANQPEGKKILKRSAWDPWGLTSYGHYSLPVIKTVRVSRVKPWSTFETLPSRGWSNPWYSDWPVVVKSSSGWVDNGWKW